MKKKIEFFFFKKSFDPMRVGYKDGNAIDFFGYPPHPAPNGMGFKFNKWVWDGYGIFFLNPGQVQGGFRYCPIPPRPAPIIYKINFKIKFNLNFKINFI